MSLSKGKKQLTKDYRGPCIVTFPDGVRKPATDFLRLMGNTCVPSAWFFFLTILFTIFSPNTFQATLLPKKWEDFTAPLRSKNSGKCGKILLWVIIATWHLIIKIECFFNFPKSFQSHDFTRAFPYNGVTGSLASFLEEDTFPPGKVKYFLPKSHPDWRESKAGIVSTIVCQANFDLLKALFQISFIHFSFHSDTNFNISKENIYRVNTSFFRSGH